MKQWIAGALWLAIAPALAGQTASEAEPPSTTRAQGYTYFALANGLGAATNLMSLGGGGEAFVYKGLAAGGDVGYLFSNGSFGYGIGLASANLSYHFRELDPNGRWVPFVTGGYTLAFRDGAGSLGNYGGGVTYWFRPHWGARVEIRNLQYSDGSNMLFRFGLSFR